jgi:HlyD family secretion protein
MQGGFDGSRGTGDAQGGGRPGLLFVLGPEGQPKPTPVKLGISDGRFVEVVDGLAEGTHVVTAVEEGATPRAQASPSSGTNNPFTPQRPQPRNR